MAIISSPDPYLNGQTLNIESVGDLPSQCLALATCIFAQPIFDGKGALSKNSKVIAMQNPIDASIMFIFNKNSAKILQNEAWRIREFGGNYTLVTKNNEKIPQGLELEIDCETDMCSSEALKAPYDEVHKKLISGWAGAIISQKHHELYNKNSDEFHTIIKDSSLLFEDRLIRHLIKKFSMEDEIECGSIRLNKIIEDEEGIKIQTFTHKLCIWFKKSILDKFIEKFGFEFN